MATKRPPKQRITDPEELRSRWLEQLRSLIDNMEAWAKALDWSTRRIEKKMEDPQIGTYKAPALLMQQETVRVLLDPIARTAAGTEGLVDLYLLPAYDDIASLYLYDGGWRLHYPLPGSPTVGNIRDTQPMPLSEETLGQVLGEMVRDAE